MSVVGLVASLPKSIVTSRELTRDVLIAGLPQATIITPENMVDIRRLSDGRTVWLETGDARRGLQHIIDRHAENFADRGVSRYQIPDLIFEAIENGRIVGSSGSGRNARSIYEVDFNGTSQRLSVGVEGMKKTYVRFSVGYMEEPVMMRDSGGFLYLEANDLDVSSQLKEDIQDWNDQYQNTLDHDDPMSSGFSETQLEKAHIEQGAELVKRLQEEFGDSYLVDYMAIAPEK